MFRRVGVVGLGTMGAGIAEVLARGGYDVAGVEINDEALARGRAHVEKSTGRAVKRGKLSADEQAAIMGRITFATDFAVLADRDLVIEAVPERIDLKAAVFAELDKVCRADAVLATNTSSLSVTEIAATTSRPEQIVGVHFFNPAPVMKLVEVIHTVRTAPHAREAVQELVQSLGKVAVTVGDRAGFVANRLLFGYLNQAATMYEQGHATREDIDAAMTGTGLPMGPLTLMDLIGLDVSLGVCEAIYAETRDRRHAPAPVLRRLVTAGFLGRKTGRGFYDYETEAEPETERGHAVLGVVGAGQLAEALTDAGRRHGAEVRVVGERNGDSMELFPLDGCDLVVDVSEDGAHLAEIAAAAHGAVLAVASSGPILDLALETSRPSDVVGLYIPEETGDTIEIVATAVSAAEKVRRAAELARAFGGHPVVSRDRAGYIVDALRMPYLNDAARMLDDGYADADAIDAAMRFGCGYPGGPAADLDRLGASRVVEVLTIMREETGEPAYVPSPLLVDLATAGRTVR